MISFCIVNFNTKTTTHETIASISRSLSGKDYEIVLADNASTDGSREYFTELKKTFANLKYVYNESNVGFGRANNIAASLSQGEILVIINPDIEVRQKGFDQFVKAKLSAEVGVLSPGLFYPDGSIQPNCGGFSTIWTYIFQSIRAGYIVRKLGITRIMSALSKSFPPLKQTIIGKYLQNFDEASCGLAKECDWVSGACMIIRKHVFNEVKGFD
ncbi:MAG TPA: glycosyltransferase, partial [Clostridia bacterium]